MSAPEGGLSLNSQWQDAARCDVTPREHRDFAVRLWNRMDRDKNGSLSPAELDCEEMRAFLKAIIAPSVGTTVGGAGAPYTRACINTQQAMSFCFRKADLNGDGRLSFEEFESFTLSLRRLAGHVPNNTAELIFALFDLDGDQMIDEAEFREIYRFFAGHRPTENVFQQEWHRLNPNFNRGVTRDEYALWLQNSSDPLFRAHAPPAVVSTELGVDGGCSVQSRPHSGASPSTSSRGPRGSGASVCGSEGDTRLTRMWKRGGLSATFGATSPSSPSWQGTATRGHAVRGGSGIAGRPKWNNKLHDAYILNPIRPKQRAFAPEPGSSGVSLGYDLMGPKTKRQYFQNHQSLPELMRYFETEKKSPVRKGFQELANKLSEPGKLSISRESLPSTTRRGRSVSDTLGPDDLDLPQLHSRHSVGGRIRDISTGRFATWNASTPVMQTGERYVNGTNSLKCPGTPPRHLSVEEFNDEDYFDRSILRG